MNMILKMTSALSCCAFLIACSQSANDALEATSENLTVTGSYSSDWESLKTHETPDWFLDAKFGIFIHWGVYSVPAWAPHGTYSEWYPRNMYQETETAEYHKQTYGQSTGVGYKDFVEDFKAENWDPEKWANLFAASGAKMVIPVAEHHDGFALWDSELTEWDSVDKGPKRDIIGELEVSIRSRGMKYAPSYHRERHFSYFREHNIDWKGEINWPWGVDSEAVPFAGVAAEIEVSPDSEGLYGPFHLDNDFISDYVKRWKEIETKYSPDMMWLDDIPVLYTSPEDPMVDSYKTALAQMIADYINTSQNQGREVAVNNKGVYANFPADFGLREADYLVSRDIRERPWIASRGIGRSYGLNVQEELKADGVDAYASSEKLIETLIDVTSKNGFFLLNVGPRADGTITEDQSSRLLDIGEWLKSNGESIYGTRPWFLSADDNIRYTRRDSELYLTCFEWPGDTLKIPSGDDVSMDGMEVRLLGSDEKIPYRVRWNKGVEVDLSGLKAEPLERPSAAYVFKLSHANVDRPKKTF